MAFRILMFSSQRPHLVYGMHLEDLLTLRSEICCLVVRLPGAWNLDKV